MGDEEDEKVEGAYRHGTGNKSSRPSWNNEMKRSLWLLVSVALVLVAVGWIANQDAAWAAPGHSPARQTYPSRTPTAEPVVSTNTPPPPTPGSPTEAPASPTETPTPVPVIPTDTPSPTAGSPTTGATATSAIPPGTLSPAPTTVSRQPTEETSTVTARAPLATQETEETRMTPTATEGSPSDPSAAPPSMEAQLVSTLAGTATTQPAVPGAGAIAAGWWLVGGVALIAAAGLLLTLGRRQGGQ